MSVDRLQNPPDAIDVISVINLTPHEITLNDIVFEPSGTVARIEEQVPISVAHQLPLVRVGRGQVVDLPDPQPNTYYLVSGMVFDAVPNTRTDVLAPFTGATAVRNEKGHIVAVTQLRCK